MDQIFQPREWFTVPDGTDLAAFLNATDLTNQDLPWNALGDMSIAAGRIAPELHSAVHVHPVVNVVTYVLAGTLTVRTKKVGVGHEPYDRQLQPGQAAVAECGTVQQLRNDSDTFAMVLYIASPSYVFEKYGDEVIYDDAILVAKTWDELAASGYDVPALKLPLFEVRARREESRRRLGVRKGCRPRELAHEAVDSLKPRYDYLAPNGSEIRQLVSGEHGGLAHCVLPAGNTSTPVCHRTVEELWYVLEGAGEVWRARDGEPPRLDPVRAGDSLRIPVDTVFQFRAGPERELKLLLATMPPWPGTHEAVVKGGGFTADDPEAGKGGDATSR